jgi:5-methylcytosine-specific restriction enzyme A
MKEGSAQAFITIFLAMMNGDEYKRAFNNETNKFLLDSIRRDFGEDYYKNALDAVQKHINYYSTLGKGNLTGLQTIVNQMRY